MRCLTVLVPLLFSVSVCVYGKQGAGVPHRGFWFRLKRDILVDSQDVKYDASLNVTDAETEIKQTDMKPLKESGAGLRRLKREPSSKRLIFKKKFKNNKNLERRR